MHTMMRQLILLGCLLSCCHLAGQEMDTISVHTDAEGLKMGKVLALPVVFYRPETRWAFGGAGSYTFRWKNQVNRQQASQLKFVMTYTLEKQLLAILPFQLYCHQGAYWLEGEIGYYKWVYDYYGIGNTTTPDQLETFQTNFPRFELRAMKLIMPGWFGGMSYRYDNFDMQELAAGGELTGGIPGHQGGHVSSLGFKTVLDRRNHIFYPTKGLLTSLQFLNSNDTWGSDYEFSSWKIQFSKYFSLGNEQVLALDWAGEFSSGEVPFYHLPRYGGARGRGYERGRYRDRQLMVINAEYRRHLFWRLGATAFVNYGRVSDNLKSFNLRDMHFAYGAGLRVLLDKTNHINLRLDYGIGDDGGAFYFTFGEAF